MDSLEFTGGAGDCWADEVQFYAGQTEHQLAGTNLLGSSQVWNWIPFTVNLPQRITLISATVYWTATRDRSDTCATYIGCEDADDPSTPTSLTDIRNRVLTSNFSTVNPIEGYTTGTEYGYDITDAVQEVLDRAGWAYGNTLAVYCDNTPGIGRRYIAASENATYDPPRLVIEFEDFVPQMIVL